jgi:formate dehydrogenase major subunit
MDTIRLTINGQQVEASAGSTILDVVHGQGLDEIPTLCHSPELEPYGSCFVCVVEVKGRANLVPACATRVAEGMEIETRNERVIDSRRTALELLISNHYADCVSPCMEGCPAHVDAQGYIALSAMGRYRDAVDLIREANPLPAVCGRVCVRKCELVCRREDVDAPVGINAVKRFVTDAPGVYESPVQREPSTGKSVGIVGAGPAGLTAAWFLGRAGHDPVIYEAQEKSGGMLRYGIPVYRLPDEVIDAEVDHIRRAGAEIRYGVRVGKDVTLDELRKRHDAVFVGVGAWTGKPMRVEGEFETEGVVTGADFLPRMNAHPEPLTGTVVVVGGGNTAMDVARMAWRLGADKVIIAYRRTKDEMPADRMEIEECLEEGVEIMELAAPVGIVADGGRLRALRCQRMKLGEPDESGRRRPVPLEGSEFDIPCQLLVSAIGQDPVLDGVEETGGAKLETTRWRTVVVDTKTMKTNIDGLFAGGDAADDGPTVVIDAIRDGQRAARAIDAYLNGKEIPAGPFVVRKEFWAKPGTTELGEIPESPRHEVHFIDVEERRGNFREVATGFEYEDNVHECARCLSCGCVRYYDCDLRLYAEQYGIDMERFRGYVRKHKVDDRHPYIVYDPNKCILCSRCIRTCARVLPISALGLVGRGFRTEMRPAMNDPLVETSCVSCGNCVDACPTGALTVKYPFPGRAALRYDETATSCAFCSLACPLVVRSFGAHRYFTAPDGPPGTYLCRYGRFGHELFIRQERYTGASVRERTARRPVDLCDAQRATVAGLRRIAEKYGPEAVGVFVSPELTSEEFYAAALIAREGLGTNNVASLSVLGSSSQAGALDQALGFTASTADRSCLPDADLIICNDTALESDHLILAVDLIEAVRKGAKLIVSNSTLDTTDQLLGSVTMDPMRGRATVLWNEIIRLLIEQGRFDSDAVASIPGAGELLAAIKSRGGDASSLCGVDEATMRQAADYIAAARSVVIVHSPDRRQDQAPGDLETMADLLLLLRATGAKAELLLPRIGSNSAALGPAGADPQFAPGRRPVPKEIAGARSRAELLGMLERGEIRGALVVGEDPMAWGPTGAWLQNIEFLAAIDWTPTETTRFADVVMPGSTFLETAGTRCNFEGRVIRYAAAVPPPAGVSGRDVLEGLAAEFGVKMPADAGEALERLVLEGTGELAPYYWNTGQDRPASKRSRLVAPDVSVVASPIAPPLTHTGRYKKEIREVGTARFRVH